VLLFDIGGCKTLDFGMVTRGCVGFDGFEVVVVLVLLLVVAVVVRGFVVVGCVLSAKLAAKIALN